MEFLNNMIDILRNSYPALQIGVVTMLRIFFIAVSLGFLLGVVIAIMRISNNIIIKGVAATFVNIMRGTPFILQLMFIYTALGLIVAGIDVLNGLDTRELSGILTIMLNAGAYFSEIVRGGINSVSRGQSEAARSLGFNRIQTMFIVILPQALRNMFPAIANQSIISLKDTSLLTTIGIGELMYQGTLISAANFKILETLSILGIIYLIIIYTLTMIFNYIEKKVRIP